MARDNEKRRARSAVKLRMRELGRRLDQWDPIGVYGHDDPPPPGEYECLIGPTMRMLHDGASATEIADMLASEQVDHFGLKPTTPPLALAQQIRLWWEGQVDSCRGPA